MTQKRDMRELRRLSFLDRGKSQERDDIAIVLN
jgi:hypothetical protein